VQPSSITQPKRLIIGGIALVLLLAAPFALRNTFASNFLPHGFCYLWDPRLLTLHLVSDLLIFCSYVAIAGTLGYLVYKGREKIPFHWMFVAFGIFIIACGFTHLMEVITIWKPLYWLAGYVKAITAMASVVTAIALPIFVPKIISDAADAASSTESEERFQTLLDSAPDAMVIVNTDGAIVLVNSQTEKVFGFSRQELLGQKIEMLIPDDFWNIIPTAPESFLSDPHVRAMGAGLELFGLRKNGDGFPIEISLSPLKTEEGTLVISAIRDITQRKLGETKLKDQAELLELTNDSIFVRDMNNVIRFWNHGAEVRYGWSREEAVGQTSSILQSQFPEPLEEIERKLSVAGHWEGEITQTTRQGAKVVVGSRWTLQRDQNGDSKGILQFSNDITERKRAEESLRQSNQDLEKRGLELEASNKELESFSYSVSHDLRAPLRQIQGFVKILVEEQGDVLDSQGRHYLTRIEESTSRMAILIDELLALAQVGRQAVRWQVTGLRSVFDEVISDLHTETDGREIEWKIGNLPFLECDAALMKIAIQNLVSNALKYTRPRAKAIIEIGMESGNTGGRQKIFVRDNGVGFNMKHADQLFGVFQRLHRVEDFDGTGIGLATVQRIIQKHSGTIWAHAELDRGATFYFELGSAGD
jgi:PAS domain S-box-containing protein